ncbi:hypothetical protein SADUNF_Sadunf11G0093500 [Salix dunnii]|uniref:Apple domain-containing protein n=1 Tax=Salix dunnii TaxID=1413687 RepID=A0A835JTW7_9ROSI|nr:hypothetical protein SADUNF_Sadunf11G0093500 [Salix dunnii]
MLSPDGYPEILVIDGSKVKYRSGPWNGLEFSGTNQLKQNPRYTYEFVYNENETFYRYHLVNNSMLWRLVISPEGDLQRFTWIDQTHSWLLFTTGNTDNCERYALCDGFRKLSGVKLPQTNTSWFNNSMDLEECRYMCLKNCSCTAYSNLDIRDGGSGCLLWFGNLVDTKEFSQNQQGNDDDAKSQMKLAHRKWISPVSLLLITDLLAGEVSELLCIPTTFFIINKEKRMTMDFNSNSNLRKANLDLPLFDLYTLACATMDFSNDNKLGEGGFGLVYKVLMIYTQSHNSFTVSQFHGTTDVRSGKVFQLYKFQQKLEVI